MAYCKILSIKRGFRSAGQTIQKTADYVKDEEKTLLNKTFNYVRNGDKTEKELFVSGGHCSPRTVVDDFMTAKDIYGDADREISHYHLIQSFSPDDEVIPELVHKMGKELAEKLCKGRFQYLVTTHLDKDHLHNHIVINGISFVDGKHFYNNKDNVRKMRKISDEICLAHGLKTINSINYLYGNGNRNPHIAAGSHMEIAKSVIDAVIAESVTLFDFHEKLAAQGFKVNLDPAMKYWTIQGKDWKRPFRIYRLGEEYTNEMLTKRILHSIDGRSDEKTAKDYFIRRKKYVVHFKGDRKKFQAGRKIGGLRGRFLVIRIRTSKRYSKRLRITDDDPRFKGSIYADKITEATRFLVKYDVKTEEDNYAARGRLFTEMRKLQAEKRKYYNICQRSKDESKVKAAEDKIDELGRKMKELRKEVKVSEWIEAENKRYHEADVHREHQREMEAKEQGNHKDKNVLNK